MKELIGTEANMGQCEVGKEQLLSEARLAT